MMYHGKELKLLARGGQADIYELDGGRVLRVLRASGPEDAQMLRNERAIMNALKARGADVPEVYAYDEPEGLPALEMQRVQGRSMLEALMRNPLGAGKLARALARLHCAVISAPALEGLKDVKLRADYLIERSELLGEADLAFVRKLLGSLPEGVALHHGDFHPGNILIESGHCYIIDWFGATKGAPLADVAHTYLLCANKPRVPGEGGLRHRFMKAFAVRFGRIYLRQMGSLLPFDVNEFGKWLAVRAAERTVIGQPSERAGRASFVRACRQGMEAGIPPERWVHLV